MDLISQVLCLIEDAKLDTAQALSKHPQFFCMHMGWRSEQSKVQSCSRKEQSQHSGVHEGGKIVEGVLLVSL